MREILWAASAGLWLLGALTAVPAAGAADSTATDRANWLEARAPAWSADVQRVDALTDGRRADASLAQRSAARFDGPFGTAVYDLGEPHAVRALRLDAHGAARWEVAFSDDGLHWRPVWQPESRGGKSRLRFELDDRTRWLRLDLLGAPSGRAWVSELQALDDARADAELAPAPAPSPCWLPVRARVPVAAILGIGLVAALVARRRAIRVPFDPDARGWTVATGVLLLGAWAYALLGFRGAGFNVDEFYQEQLGREIVDWYLAWIRSGHYEPFQSVSPSMNFYGGFFEAGAEWIGRVSPLPLTETRHLITALFGSLAIPAVHLLGRQLSSRAAGFFAAFALFSMPRFFGHFFVNPKDVPFAVCHVLVLISLVGCLRRLPVVPVRWIAALGMSVGALIGTRVGGAFVVAYLGVALLAWVALEYRRGRPPGAAELRELVRASAAVALLAGIVVLLSWPWIWRAVLGGPLTALVHFHDTAGSLGHEFMVFFEGSHIPYSRLPRWYTLEWIAITLPDLFLLAAPVVFLLWARRGASAAVPPDDVRRIGLGAVAASVLLPLAITLSGAVSQFGSLRHFLFVLPPLAVLFGDGFASALSRCSAAARLGLVVAGAGLAALGLWDAARLHPYEYLYFNRSVAGGLSLAARRYETDYLGLSHKAGVAWLLEHYRPRHREPVRVTSCAGFSVNVEKPLRETGERAAWFVYVPPDREMDVALASPRSDCHREFDGRLIATIQREGVVLLYLVERREPDRPGRG